MTWINVTPRSLRWFGLLGLTALAAIPRLVGLTEETLFFEDEGVYLKEARALLGIGVGGAALYAKPLYVGLIAMALKIGGNQIAAAQYLVAGASTLWVPALYWFTRRLFPREGIAWMSVMLAAADPWSLLYGRHLFPDPVAGLCWLFSLGLLLPQPRNARRIFLSGILFGCAVAANYRMVILAPGTLLFLWWVRQDPWGPRVRYLAQWLLGMALVLLLCHIGYELVRPPEIGAYLHQLYLFISLHTGFGLRGDGWLTYPTLVLHYEGAMMLLGLLFGLLTILTRGEGNTVSKKLLCCAYLLPLVACASYALPYARLFSPLLLWHPILTAIAITALVDHLRFLGRWRRPVYVILTAGVVLTMLPRLVRVQGIRMPYRSAIAAIEAERGPCRLFTLLATLVREILPDWWIGAPNPGEIIPIELLRKSDVAYALIDHSRHNFTTTPAAPRPTSPQREPTAHLLATTCPRLLEFACGSQREFWINVAWETNINYRATQHFLRQKELDGSPCLEVYDVAACRIPGQ